MSEPTKPTDFDIFCRHVLGLENPLRKYGKHWTDNFEIKLPEQIVPPEKQLMHHDPGARRLIEAVGESLKAKIQREAECQMDKVNRVAGTKPKCESCSEQLNCLALTSEPPDQDLYIDGKHISRVTGMDFSSGKTTSNKVIVTATWKGVSEP